MAKSDAKPAKPMTREVIDESGRRVAVPIDVRRIVSLAPNLTEIVYALGGQDRLVAVSNYSDSVPAAKTKPHVGMPMNPSLEAIVGARPDIVLAAA
ncbi:MAG TPA: ABC transporter substrate-binding protein, partial [Candidatus Limnocylindrales bacterium]|nr:ABC transporter substrate-binding protein [Candidatus Limnocylindrales bacterium]